MNEKIRFIVSGFFVGLAELIPGISGSTVALIFNVYEKLIRVFANISIKKLSPSNIDFKKDFELDLLIPFILSMIISVVFFSRLILFLYTAHTEVFELFLGLTMIFASLYLIKDLSIFNYKNILFFILGIFVTFILNFIDFNSVKIEFFPLIAYGFIAFSFFLIPGISGSAIMLVLGIYVYIIEAVASINLYILIPFGLGCLTSLLLMPKVINYLYNAYKEILLSFFVGLIVSSGAILIYG